MEHTQKKNKPEQKGKLVIHDKESGFITKQYFNTKTNGNEILSFVNIENDLISLASKKEERPDKFIYTDLQPEMENIGFIAIAIHNLSKKPIEGIKIKKDLSESFHNLMIIDTTIGMAEQIGQNIIWTINELISKQTGFMKLKVDISDNSNDIRKIEPFTISLNNEKTRSDTKSFKKNKRRSRNALYRALNKTKSGPEMDLIVLSPYFKDMTIPLIEAMRNWNKPDFSSNKFQGNEGLRREAEKTIQEKLKEHRKVLGMAISKQSENLYQFYLKPGEDGKSDILSIKIEILSIVVVEFTDKNITVILWIFNNGNMITLRYIKERPWDLRGIFEQAKERKKPMTIGGFPDNSIFSPNSTKFLKDI